MAKIKGANVKIPKPPQQKVNVCFLSICLFIYFHLFIFRMYQICFLVLEIWEDSARGIKGEGNAGDCFTKCLFWFLFFRK